VPVLVAGELAKSGRLADAEATGSSSLEGARPSEVMDLGEAAAGTSFQPGHKCVSLREDVEDLGDEQFYSTFALQTLASSSPAASSSIASCPLPIVLSHRAPHRSCERGAGGTRCSSASTLLHRASESCPLSAR